MKIRRLGLIGLLLVFVLSGCVVAEKNGRITSVGLDHAEIFGKKVGTFKLADGTEGTLRRDVDGKYSIKLQKYHKMVLVQQSVVSARIAHVTELGGRTSVLIEYSEKRCGNNYQLFNISGSQVSSWTFGNCKDRPRVFVENDQQFFDFPAGRYLTRYRLAGDEVRSGRVLPPEGYPPFTEPFATEALQVPEMVKVPGRQAGANAGTDQMRNGRVIPPPPIAVAAGAAPGSAAAARPSVRKAEEPTTEPVAARKSRPIASRNAGRQPDLVFDEEVRPVRVVDLR